MLSTRRITLPLASAFDHQNQGQGAIKRVFLVSHPNRGRLLSIVADPASNPDPDPPAWKRPPRDLQPTGFPNSSQLTNLKLLDQPTSATITSFNDAPEPVRWVVQREDPTRWEMFTATGEQCVGGSKGLAFAGLAPNKNAALLTPDTYRAALGPSWAGLPEPKRSQVAAFARMDAMTNPALLLDTGSLQSQTMLVAVQRLRRFLELTLRRRGAAEKAGLASGTASLVGDPSPALIEACKFVSRILLDTLNVGTAEESAQGFERFANGELRTPLGDGQPGVWTTQPSSGAFFLFAEFAMLAVHCDIQRDQWTEWAKVMTRSQLMYMDVYRPNVRAPRFEDWGACDFRPGRQWRDRAKEGLRDHTAVRPFAGLQRDCARNALIAFPGSFA